MGVTGETLHVDAGYHVMGGPPMGSQFDAEKARIALEFVDEFVAQSDVYPIEP